MTAHNAEGAGANSTTQTVAVQVIPDTETPTLTASAGATLTEGQAEALNIAVGNTDADDTVTVTIAGLPSGAYLTDTADGAKQLTGSSITLTGTNITDGNPNSTIKQVALYVQLNGSNTLLGYATQTSPGVWTFNYTVNLAPGSYTLFAQAEDSYGVFGDPLALTLTVQ